MPKKDADNGAANLKAVLSNQTSLSDLTDDQLSAIGGSRDPIDSEDFSDADFGDEVTPQQSDDEPGDEVDEDNDEDNDDAEGDDNDGAAGDDEGAGEEGGDDESDADDSGESDDGGEDASDDAEDQDEDADEGEDEDEDEGEDEDEDESDGKGKKDQRVPLERFREVNKRMREAEKRLEQMERELAAGRGEGDGEGDNAPPPYDFDKAEAEYQDLVLDGKKEDAIAKRREIRAAERAEFQKEAKEVGTETAEASHVKRQLATLAAKYETDYPAMDESHDDYNPEVNLEVEAMMLGYLQTGMAPPAAFKKALDRAVKLYDLKPIGEAPAPGKGKGKDKGKAKPGKDDASQKKLDKKAKAGKVKAAKAKGAPPDTTKVGDAGDGGKGVKGKVDYENMSEEEFNALPKSTLARLRGDIL